MSSPRLLLPLLFGCLIAACSAGRYHTFCARNSECLEGKAITGIDVNYYCECDAGFMGQNCERTRPPDYIVTMGFNSQKGPIVRGLYPQAQHCVTVYTNCVNGAPHLSQSLVCE